MNKIKAGIVGVASLSVLGGGYTVDKLACQGYDQQKELNVTGLSVAEVKSGLLEKQKVKKPKTCISKKSYDFHIENKDELEAILSESSGGINFESIEDLKNKLLKTLE